METRAALLTLVLAAAVVAAPLAAAQVTDVEPTAADAVDQPTTAGDAQTTTVAPGARLAGVVGAQRAGLDGVVERRAFEARLDAANTTAAKARVVAAEYETITERLSALRDRQETLVAAHRNGSVPDTVFQARAAALATAIANLERLANRTAEAASGLPAAALAERGVSVTAIERLRSSAHNLTGPEVAAVARTIAGRSGGERGPPGGVVTGPPGDAGPSGDGPGEGDPPGAVPGAGDGQDSDGDGATATSGPPGSAGPGETAVPTESNGDGPAEPADGSNATATTAGGGTTGDGVTPGTAD
ncbi:MAG: hypothetical protein ABEJ42_09185 [Halobacteriaceae archaeon]